MAKQGFNISAYLNDFGGCHASYYQAKKAYDRFLLLAEELGLELSPHKCTLPATAVEWLGYRVDSVAMSIKIPVDKMKEVLNECKS